MYDEPVGYGSDMGRGVVGEARQVVQEPWATCGAGSSAEAAQQEWRPRVLKQREDLLGTTSASSLVYGSLDGWRRQMVEQGGEMLERVIEPG
jgi:hypothetical protein